MMTRTLVAAVLVVLAPLGGSGGAASDARSLLALADGALHQPSRLVAVDPWTLAARPGRGVTLPGHAFGFH